MVSSVKKFDFRRWVPGVVISALAIFVIFQLVSWEDLDQAFKTIHLIFLLPGAVLVLLWLFLRAAALKVILGGKPTVWQAFRAINIGYLLNNIFPLRAGELGKAIVLGKSTGNGTSYVLSGIVIERAFDLTYAAALLLLALPFVLEMNWTRPVAIGVLIIVVMGFTALYLASKNYGKILSWLERLGSRTSWVKKFVIPQLNSFFEGLQTITDIKRFLLSLLMIGISWLAAVILYYVMLFSITPDPGIWWGVFINSILAMGIALPSAPAALGVFEASLVAGLGVLGISYSYALAYAVLMHFIQFAITGILGFFSLAREKQSITDLLSAKREKRNDVSEEMVSSEQMQ